jgi:peptidoglycan hydrolase-like protein with peptidoglycan-binding domain
MKKILISLIVLVGVLSAHGLIKATSSTSSAQDLITTLQEQIAKLSTQIAEMNVQLQVLRQAQSQIRETTQEVKGTLQILKHLKLGMTSEEVKQLQELLSTDPEIYPEGLITGYYGRLTEKAVKKFQKRICLEEVGEVGPKTLRKINELLTEGAGKSGKIPPGLLTAPGIQKKLCATSITDTTAPVISDVIATSTTATTTQIKWFTNELADSKVWYSAVTPVAATSSTPSVSFSAFVLDHTVKLSVLNASTTYYYLVTSTDKSGNTTTATEKSFITLP